MAISPPLKPTGAADPTGKADGAHGGRCPPSEAAQREWDQRPLYRASSCISRCRAARRAESSMPVRTLGRPDGGPSRSRARMRVRLQCRRTSTPGADQLMTADARADYPGYRFIGAPAGTWSLDRRHAHARPARRRSGHAAGPLRRAAWRGVEHRLPPTAATVYGMDLVCEKATLRIDASRRFDRPRRRLDPVRQFGRARFDGRSWGIKSPAEATQSAFRIGAPATFPARVRPAHGWRTIKQLAVQPRAP